MRTPSRAARVLSLLLLASSPACTSWQASSLGADAIPALSPGRARLTLPDGSAVVLARPVVEGDSIVGTARLAGERVRYAAAVANVRQVETRRPDTAKTVAAALVGTLVTAGAVVVGIAAAVSTEGT